MCVCVFLWGRGGGYSFSLLSRVSRFYLSCSSITFHRVFVYFYSRIFCLRLQMTFLYQINRLPRFYFTSSFQLKENPQRIQENSSFSKKYKELPLFSSMCLCLTKTNKNKRKNVSTINKKNVTVWIVQIVKNGNN